MSDLRSNDSNRTSSSYNGMVLGLVPIQEIPRGFLPIPLQISLPNAQDNVTGILAPSAPQQIAPPTQIQAQVQYPPFAQTNNAFPQQNFQLPAQQSTAYPNAIQTQDLSAYFAQVQQDALFQQQCQQQQQQQQNGGCSQQSQPYSVGGFP